MATVSEESDAVAARDAQPEEPFVVWSLTRCPASVLVDPEALEEAVKVVTSGVVAVWDRHPGSAGRTRGNVVVEAARVASLFSEEGVVEIRAMLGAV